MSLEYRIAPVSASITMAERASISDICGQPGSWLLATGIGVGAAVGAVAASAAAVSVGKAATPIMTAEAAASVARQPRNFFINIIISSQ
jgi:hypothetical protein